MKKNRGKFFEFVKKIFRIFSKKPKFIYLGEKLTDKAIYLSNHVGATVPFKMELYFPLEFRFWGTYEMNGSLKEVYRYLSKIYFHQKKHIPLWICYIISIVAAPFMKCFYKGIRLISTYPDGRMVITMKQSLEVALNSDNSFVIFPEDSSKGYFDFLKGFHPGFFAFAKRCYEKHQIDFPIYLMYYQRLNNTFIVDKPIMFSTLNQINSNMKEVANLYLKRINEIAAFNEKDIFSEQNNPTHFMKR
ncbi:MAG: hypothetical protein MR270_06055 [Erysipelotrichaceae bacterium]|nr:hypothetical protein [Erysipelotrichaceae bacterium]